MRSAELYHRIALGSKPSGSYQLRPAAAEQIQGQVTYCLRGWLGERIAVRTWPPIGVVISGYGQVGAVRSFT
jgi:hypothetical protein